MTQPHNLVGARDRDRCIAVVTVCLNPGPLLKTAIDSVMALNDARVRQIVIDGASTDGTVEFLRAHAATLHFWSSEPDAGIYDAMNKGWAAAPADAYVIFIGADDRLLALPPPDELRRHEEAGYAIVFGTTHLGSTAFRSRVDRSTYWRNSLHHQSLMIRKDLSSLPPFNIGYRVYGDWDLNVRLLKAGNKAIFSPALQAEAFALGASSRLPLRESFRVGLSNSGLALGLMAWSWAAVVRLRRRFKKGWR